MLMNFYDAMKERRSIYNISDSSPISDEKIKEIIEESVKHTPTAFNSQSGRVILLLNDKHKRFWDITEDALRKVVPEGQFEPTEQKIESFRKGYGTILFFEDQDTVESLKEQFPLYKESFPIYSLESSGMLQYNIWTGLAINGLGASLQHYTELIEEDVKSEWNIDKSWKLLAQLPFGKKEEDAGEKEFLPLDKRVKILD
ncbi:nitroreductase family protein [Senegalia massiliensis]|uniref:Nitroreductase n=1 Tax=Senegalia massiliensis TaxID=1720316 RepID=A0A845QWU8_9CLOT|nr:nitroreductase [Senegalia massiliensis]